MSVIDYGAPDLLVLCRSAVDGDEKALEHLLAVINSGSQDQVNAAFVLTPCIIDMFEASSKEEDRMSRFIALILTALHNRICAVSPSPAVFQVPWPLPARGVGVGSLSEEHVRAVTTHKIAMRSVVACHSLPADPATLLATWPLIETLCCSCISFLVDRDVCDRRDSAGHAQRVLIASSTLRLAQRVSTGAAPPFMTSRLSVSLCMLLIKIIPPHPHCPAAVTAAAVVGIPLPALHPTPPQPTNQTPAAATAAGSSVDDIALAHTCCTAGRAWNLFAQITLDTDLFLCSSVLLDGPLGVEIQM